MVDAKLITTVLIVTDTMNNKWNEWTKLIKTSIHETTTSLSNRTITTLDKCNNCGSCSLQEDHTQGYISCPDCGCVHETIIDNSAEWKIKSDQHAFAADAVRCAPVDDLLPNLSLSTKIEPQYGTKHAYTEYHMAKIHRWYSVDPIERALKVDFDFIDELYFNRKCVLPRDVLQVSKLLFKEFYMASYDDCKQYGDKRDCLRGQSRKGMIGVCIHFGCKMYNIHCSKEEIAKLVGVQPIKIRKARQSFLTTLQHKIVNIKGWNDSISKISNVSDFIRSFETLLGAPPYIHVYAILLYKYLKPTRVLGSKQPQSIAATCLWLLLNQFKSHITIDHIVKKCDISKATIKDIVTRVQPYIKEGSIIVFCRYTCDKAHIENNITINRITEIALCIKKIHEHINTNYIVATAIIFVLITKDITIDHTLHNVISLCNVQHDKLLGIVEQLMVYKDALIKKFID